MEYLYAVTVTYDNELTPRWIGRYDNALAAVEVFQSVKDWGFADEFSTVNLSEPNGKMHTKVLYREGRKVVTK